MNIKELQNNIRFQLFCLIGSIIACAMSWNEHKEIGWAIWHFLCGWVYVSFSVVVDLLK